MTLPRKAYLFPVRFADANPVIRIHPDSAGAGTEQDVTLSVAANTSYYLSGDGQSDDLLEILRAALDSNSDGETYTVTLASATQTITIASASANEFDVLWTHANTTVDAEIFGFASSDLTGADSYAAPSATQGAWLPLQEVKRDTGDDPQIVGQSLVTQGGLVHGSSSGDTIYHRDLTYDLLVPAVIKEADVVSSGLYNSLERAWVTEALGRGNSVRVYDDATVRTTSSFKTYQVRTYAQPWRDMFEEIRVRNYEVRLELVRTAAAVAFTNTLALDFDGVDEYVDCGAIASFNGATRVVWSFWVDTWQNIDWLLTRYSTSDRQWAFITSGSDLECRMATGATSHATFTTTTGAFGTGYQHVLIDYDGSSPAVTVYRNGSSQTGSVGGTLPSSLRTTTGSISMLMGSIVSGGANFYTGRQDEVAVWFGSNAAAVVVDEVYNSGSPPNLHQLSSTPSPDHFWRMGDDSTFPTIQDIGAVGGFDGTMVNMEAGDIVANVP